MAHAREIENLDCGAGVLAGGRLVLQTRLEEVFSFQDAPQDEIDEECVHDMRVATRRLRSALRDFKPYLEYNATKRELKTFGAEIKRLADALGAVRDLDVQLALLEKLKAQESEASAAIEFFQALRRDEGKTRRDELKNELERIARDDFFQMLNLIFDAATISGANQTDEAKSFRAAAREIVEQRFVEFEKKSDALLRPRAARRLHRLRIAAKRLRYAVELFAPCFDHEARKSAKEIAKLQTSLGDLHDCDVWLDELAARLQRKNDGEMNDAAHFGALRLVHHFTAERTRHYQEALARWQQWQKENFCAHLLKKFEIENS
jgi:CHAD domain-containing protein